MRRIFLLALPVLAGFFLSGCSFSDTGERAKFTAVYGPLPHASVQEQPGDALLLKSNMDAGDALAAQLLLRVGSGSGILSASLVELRDLDKSSLLGQTCAEQIGSRLSQHGFKVLDSRLGADIRMEKTGGEFMLTRDSAKLLSENLDAHAALLGVYSETGQRVFLSVRVVRLNDNAVIAAYEYYLPKHDDIVSLLGNGNNRGNNAGGSGHPWFGYATREQAFP
jgi:TolB-like protein